MKQPILTGKHIVKRFSQTDTAVLQQLNVELYEGDFTVIMGASGAGKSTLLYALSGMSDINEGEIIFQHHDIAHNREKQMAVLRRNAFGFVFQQTHLVSNLTLLENVAVAGYLNDDKTSRQTKKRAEMLLESMHVAHVMNRLPSQVSGGEAQRAAIARAIINEPDLLFADEPTGALNRKNSDEVLHLLGKLHENGQSILMVTHDIRAASYGTRILYMDDGKILDELDLSNQLYRKEKEVKVNQWLTTLMW